MPVIVAHRGLHVTHPENSLAAFTAAWDGRTQWCECDVQLTADHRTVVLHDDELDRTTNGKGSVSQKLWDAIRGLRLVDQAGRLTAEPVPLLTDLLQAMPADKGLLVELKQPMTAFHHVARMHLKRGLRLVLQSFDAGTIEALCDAGLGKHSVLLLDQPGFLPLAGKLGCAGVHVRHDLLDSRQIEDAHARGIWVGGWTVNARRDVLRLAEMGVDWIITDRPTDAASWLDER